MDAAQALSDLTEISSQIDVRGRPRRGRLDDGIDGRRGARAGELARTATGAARGRRRASRTRPAARAARGRDGRRAASSSSATGERPIVADDPPSRPLRRLVFYDLKSALRGVAPTRSPSPGGHPERRPSRRTAVTMPRRKVLTGLALGSRRWRARSSTAPVARRRDRVDALLRRRRDDLAGRRLARRVDGAAAGQAVLFDGRTQRLAVDDAARLRPARACVPGGRFRPRSGKRSSYYLDKSASRPSPTCSRRSACSLPPRWPRRSPGPRGWPADFGAVALAAAASLASACRS